MSHPARHDKAVWVSPPVMVESPETLGDSSLKDGEGERPECQEAKLHQLWRLRTLRQQPGQGGVWNSRRWDKTSAGGRVGGLQLWKEQHHRPVFQEDI